MFRPTRWTLSGLSAVAAFLLIPAVAAGQFTPDPVLAAHDAADRAHDHAMVQGEAADGMAERMTVLAESHRTSADLRLLSDPRAFECKVLQANYLYLSGETVEAVKYLMQAAMVARANGDLFGAATAYIDAGVVAAEAGLTDEAARFASEARSLVQRPGLSPEERLAVQRRLAS